MIIYDAHQNILQLFCTVVSTTHDNKKIEFEKKADEAKITQNVIERKSREHQMIPAKARDVSKINDKQSDAKKKYPKFT